MRFRPSISAGVVLVVLLTGCGAVIPAAPTAQADWVEPTGSLPADLPPGVSESGVDAAALTEANRDALANESFALRTTLRDVAGSSGTTVRAAADRSRVRLRVDTTGPDRDVFLANDTVFVRTHRDGETSVRIAPRTEADAAVPDSFVRDGRLAQFAGAARHVPVGTVERDGETLVVLEANGSTLSEDAFGDLTVEAFRSQILVGGDGLVYRHLGVIEGTDASGDPIRSEVRYALEEVGNVSVETPAWVDGTRGA